MSIASRITQMEQHIGNAYDKIEDLGIDLTDVDKNIDNISSMLENVWDEYPKVTATDVEEASIDGTKKGRMKLDLKGNTEQEQLTGKNLFDNSVINNSWIATNGTITTDNSASSFRYSCSSGDTYTISASFEDTGTSNIIVIAFYDENDSMLLRGVAVGSSNKEITLTKTAPENTAYMYAGHYTKIPTKIQLEKSSTATSYEPYCGGIPAPNPDYPQTIHNVIGNNEFKIQNKNICNLPQNTTLPMSVNSTTIYESANDKTFSNITISFIFQDVIATYNSAALINFKYADNTNSYLTLADLNLTANTTINGIYSKTYTNKTFNRVIAYLGSNYSTFTQGSVSIQIEQGSTATTYVEHQEQNLPFSLRSKNLFNPNGEFENGFYSTDGEFYPNSSWRCMSLKCKQGDVFTRSGGSWGGIVTFWNDDIFVSGFNSYSLTTTIPTGANKVKFACRYPFNGDEQLEQGTTATDYEPYYDIKAMQGTTLQDDGIHQKRKQKIFDGTEYWLPFTSQGRTSYYTNLPDGGKKEIALCSHFICQVGGGFPEKNKFLYNGATNKNIIFYTGDTENKLTQWKSYLAEQYANGTPVIVEYELETEEIIPYKGVQQEQYNAIKKAQSYDDQTNITQKNEDLPFILNIEALKK